LQREMLNYWGRDKVQFGKRGNVEENADGVTAWFTDGTTAHGDFLIAADGSHSALRPVWATRRNAATRVTSTGTAW
jgi:FAD-dependent urate hydroxylase